MYEEENKRSLWLPVLIAMLITTFALIVGWLIVSRIGKKPEAEPTAAKPTSTQSSRNDSTEPAAPTDPTISYQEKIEEIQALIDYYYIGDVDEKEMGDSIAAGMIAGLGDEWSYYITAEEYSAYEESVMNSYVGIGVTITSEDVEKGVRITDVTPNSPAYAAGLQTGDLVMAVEGVPILDGSDEAIDMTETKNRVRGQEGTDVTLTISRDGREFDVTITRATIKVVNVSSEDLGGGLTYIKISNFETDAAADTIAAIEAAMENGAKGIIFDVRYNPGGYKHELLEVLDYILPEGPLFRSVDYRGRESVDKSDAAHIEIPMAVLVNYDSYSAAEFFAAALQEYDYAVIVGEQTYGKGRFQSNFRLSDGSAINISIGEYSTPMGVVLVGKGITPDHVVEFTDEEKADLYYGRLSHEDDKQLQKAISVLTNGED